MTPNATSAPPPRRGRSGSQKRRRGYSLQIALDGEEFAHVKEYAARAGLSASSYGRAAMLGLPGPRARRAPTLNAEVIARATAALNKVGSLLNQIARVLNAGGAIKLAQECFAAFAEVKAAAAAIRNALGRTDRP